MSDRLPAWFPLKGEQIDATQMRNLPRVVVVILALMAIVTAVQLLAPRQIEGTIVVLLGTSLHFDGQFIPFRIYSLFTSWLPHDGIFHFIFNAFWIAGFGPLVHRHLGATRFVIFFILTAAAGSLAAELSHWGRTVFSIGASGAVFGIIGAGAYLLTSGANVAAKLRNMVLYIAVFMALNIGFAMIGGEAFGVDGPISWQAHTGGLIAGLFLFPLLAVGARPRRG